MPTNGVTLTAADGLLVPPADAAVTLQEYVVPFVSPVTVSIAFPVFVMVIVAGELEPMGTAPNARLPLKLIIRVTCGVGGVGDGAVADVAFDVDPYRRRALLQGLDEIGTILSDDAADIAAFEKRQESDYPWLRLDGRLDRLFADMKDSK